MTPGREIINSEASADIRFGALADSSRTSRDVRKVPPQADVIA
jgi:hypothetical protein